MNRLALSSICAFRLVLAKLLSASGDGEIRTLDPLLARQVLSQLSYAPILMGLSGLEPPTSRLSGVRSNRLSYKPIESGIHLLSHAVSSIVPSAAYVLTVVFGMGTGVSHKRIDTRIIRLSSPPAVLCKPSYGAALPKPFRKARQYSLSSIQSQENRFSCSFLSAILCRLP